MMGQGQIVEVAMDCIEAVEVIGRTWFGIIVLYMENSGERESLPYGF